MSNTYTAKQRQSRKDARRRWLERSPLLPLLPGAAEDVSYEQSSALGLALMGMRAVGLYAATSELRASRWRMRLTVSAIRGERVSGKDQRYKS